MIIFKQTAIIFLFSIIGEIISYFLVKLFPSIFLPGAIIGMLLLAVFLYKKWLKLEHIDKVGNFLVNNMAFFFIPPAVSVVNYLDILGPIFIKVIIICLVTTIITFLSVAGSVKLTIIIQDKISQRREKNERNN